MTPFFEGGKPSIFCLSDQLMFNSWLLPSQSKEGMFINRKEKAKSTTLGFRFIRIWTRSKLFNVILKGMSENATFLKGRKEGKVREGKGGQEGREGGVVHF